MTSAFEGSGNAYEPVRIHIAALRAPAVAHILNRKKIDASTVYILTTYYVLLSFLFKK